MHKRQIPAKLTELLLKAAHLPPADYIQRSIANEDAHLSDKQLLVLDALGGEIHGAAKNVCNKFPFGEFCRTFITDGQTHVAAISLSRTSSAAHLEMEIHFDIRPILDSEQIKAYDENVARILSPEGTNLSDEDLETLARVQLEDQHGALRVPATDHLSMTITCQTAREYKESRASIIDLASRVFGDESSDWATNITFEWSNGLVGGPSAQVCFSTDEMMIKTTELFGYDLSGSFESGLAALKDASLTTPATIPDLELVQRAAPIALQIMCNLQKDPPEAGPEESL